MGSIRLISRVGQSHPIVSLTRGDENAATTRGAKPIPPEPDQRHPPTEARCRGRAEPRHALLLCLAVRAEREADPMSSLPPPGERLTVRRRVIVHGRVQGVGFRFAVARAADARAVTGWVRNRADGAVEAVFEGEPE